MTWRDDLRRVRHLDGRRLIGASFRGVPFFVEEVERTGGRRAVVHEFPLRDDPFVEDLGRRARAFPVEGYVIGDDYLRQRDQLLAALEDTAGPGSLVHPYYGTRSAICSNLRVRETVAEGGMARFSIEFTEAPAQAVAPTEEVDLPARASESADSAIAASRAEFVDRYNVTGLPSFALESAESALRNMADSLADKFAPIVQVTQEAARLDAQIHAITSQASSLIRQPAGILGALQGAMSSLAETAAGSPGAVLRALLDTYGTDLGTVVVETTATRRRERANQLALFAALRRVLVIEAARLAPRVPFPSIEEATAARDAVAARLEEQAATAGDTAYPALVQLRADVLRAVPGDRVFARVLTVSRRVAVPSLLLSYQLYGSVAQEADVLARNGVRHPGFISGDLKVLSDG